MKIVFVALGLLAANTCLAATPAVGTVGTVGLNPGELFPTIVLPSLRDGKPASLAEFRGKKVLLHIFASW